MSMRLENDGSAPLGTPDKITLHWTAGSYTATYDHYHWCVLGTGEVVQTRKISSKGSHTWQRNAGNIGLSMCCMADGYPPTKRQIEAIARLTAELVGIYGISWEDVHDHWYYAKLDGYENLRWDVGSYTDIIIKKAKWYRQQIISGKMKNSLVGNIQ